MYIFIISKDVGIILSLGIVSKAGQAMLLAFHTASSAVRLGTKSTS